MRHQGALRLGPRALCLGLALLPLPAAAGLFDDTEARRQIAELRNEVRQLSEVQAQGQTQIQGQFGPRIERMESALRMQLELANQIESLRGEMARLRGQIEVLQNDSGNTQKRQRDYYVDLDTRLRALEEATAKLAQDAAAPPPPAPVLARPDPAQVTREYEAALAQFRAAKYDDAHKSFSAFVAAYGDDPLAPSAQYWIGNSLYALRDCRRAVAAQEELLRRWPDSNKAPDALLAIGTCQRELGDAAASRKTLETLVARHPSSPAAGKARERLKK
jgi:tol-pal system protein YbgF